MSGRNQASHSGSFYEDAESDSLRRMSDFSMSDWMRKLGEAEVFESDLQHLILNYLTINGLAGPAEEFIKEARIDRKLGPCYADEQLLNADAEVTFLLHKQQLLRLIEAGDPEDAIDFAQQHLAPCVKECPHLLPQLEEVMALLAFNDLSCPEAQRLIGGMEQREETARRIDEAILDLYRIEQVEGLEGRKGPTQGAFTLAENQGRYRLMLETPNHTKKCSRKPGPPIGIARPSQPNRRRKPQGPKGGGESGAAVEERWAVVDVGQQHLVSDPMRVNFKSFNYINSITAALCSASRLESPVFKCFSLWLFPNGQEQHDSVGLIDLAIMFKGKRGSVRAKWTACFLDERGETSLQLPCGYHLALIYSGQKDLLPTVNLYYVNCLLCQVTNEWHTAS
ncbi:Expressed protein, related [Eimeria praecox]|uniref:Expressed protein, related n=1 Tax=Eimeria praecox TaxID=51316 RepID=U6G4J1_9EIME|nr:Expressed protein, related [Eimeria praecox]